MSTVGTNPDPHLGPFPGQRPFTNHDGRWFFGRGDEIRDVARMWRKARVAILYGGSGIGKTSLLRAGVLPYLSAESNVLPIGRVSHGLPFPMAAIPEQNPFTLALLTSWRPDQTPARMSALSITGFLRSSERTDRHGRHLDTLVAIDQAERLFSDADPRHRSQFVDELQEALEARPRTRLLLSVREDHLDDTRQMAKLLGADAASSFLLRPFGRKQALEAIGGPVRAAGRDFEPGVADRLVSELGDGAPGHGFTVEPALLQAVGRRLWEELPPDCMRVPERQVPDVDQVLTDWCAQTLSAVAADHNQSRPDLLAWLRACVNNGHYEPDAVPELPGSVIRSLQDQHLVKKRTASTGAYDRHEGATAYEVQHQRLIGPLLSLIEGRWPGRWETRHPDPEALMRAAEVASSAGEYERAEQHARAAVSRYDESDVRQRAEAETFLGNLALHRGQPDAAAKHYGDAAKIFELLRDTEAVAWLLAAVGMLKLDQGDREAAVRNLRSAAARMPNNPVVQTELGQAMWHLGQADTALAILGGVLTRDGDTPAALCARGEILADMGDAESALRDLERVDHRPRPSVRAARALALATLSHVEMARQDLDEIVAQASDNGPVLLRAAEVQRLSGDVDAATSLASRAIRATDPPLPPHQKAKAQRLSQE